MLTLTTKLFFQQEDSLLHREYLSHASNLLDIGCGNGAYLEEIKQHYPHLHCIGLEKDGRIFRYAEQRSKPGLEFVHADYREMAAPAAPFDVVIARLIVTHLTDLEQFFAWLGSITHETSTIIIIDLDDAATGPAPPACLPLFESLFRASRKTLLDRYPVPLAKRINDAIVKVSNIRIELKSYRRNVEDLESKTDMHRYMETVTKIMQTGFLSVERKLELDRWLLDDASSYQAGMFALIIQRAQLHLSRGT
ncbi:methyltransferase domain-containing protein [Paenibacillus sp. T1]|uniref:Methyltransferase domain-containing protein n=2 Tax=Paenibacillus glycinis TaxID=2697035 RepID=A0ABW9XKN5_9BACL|nr:methyltransferase domain-containing protein [Paenibacillus glycinis]